MSFPMPRAEISDCFHSAYSTVSSAFVACRQCRCAGRAHEQQSQSEAKRPYDGRALAVGFRVSRIALLLLPLQSAVPGSSGS